MVASEYFTRDQIRLRYKRSLSTSCNPMARIPILRLEEASRRRWQYSTNHTDGALRLVRVDSLLDKHNPAINLDEFRDLQWGSTQKPLYAAISHVWEQSRSVRRITKRINRPLEIETEGGRSHTISWHGLVQAARAAKYLRCEHLWLDFVCLHQTSKTDKKLQIKNMGHIYQNATAVLVMPGGVSAAQRAEKSAGWINRAWTLQESTLCPDTYVLLDWPRRHSITVGGIKNAKFESLGDIAVIRLLGLLEIRVSPEDIYYEVDGEEDEELKIDVECFGQDTKALMALWAMLEANGDPYVLKSAAWRSMWMRTSTKPQDLVFSVLHIFGADIEVDYSRPVDDLLLELAAKTATFPVWLYVGHDMPINPRSQLLPALPTFVPNSVPVYETGRANIPVSSFIISFDYISKFDIKVTSLPDLTGHSICGQFLEVKGWEEGESGLSDKAFLDTYFPGDDTSDQTDDEPTTSTLHLASSTGEAKVESRISGSVGTHMVILGETSPYRFLEFQEMAVLSPDGPSVLFFRQTTANDGIWENCGSARLNKSITGTERRHLDVGICPGAYLRTCTCTGYPERSELKPLAAYDRPDRYKGYGYLFPGLDDDGGGGNGPFEHLDGDVWEDEDEFCNSEGDGDPIFD